MHKNYLNNSELYLSLLLQDIIKFDLKSDCKCNEDSICYKCLFEKNLNLYINSKYYEERLM